MNDGYSFEWVFSPVGGVADYKCGNPFCNVRAPIGYENFNYCPYCGVKKSKPVSNSVQSLDTNSLDKITTELKMG